jgi:hypothetical protein
LIKTGSLSGIVNFKSQRLPIVFENSVLTENFTRQGSNRCDFLSHLQSKGLEEK